jgi:hypothetical protein
MMRALALLLFVGAVAAACATPLPQVIPTGAATFEVRYDPAAQTTAEADARANQHCGGEAEFIAGETRYDGFAYRSYRCTGG